MDLPCLSIICAPFFAWEIKPVCSQKQFFIQTQKITPETDSLTLTFWHNCCLPGHHQMRFGSYWPIPYRWDNLKLECPFSPHQDFWWSTLLPIDYNTSLQQYLSEHKKLSVKWSIKQNLFRKTKYELRMTYCLSIIWATYYCAWEIKPKAVFFSFKPKRLDQRQTLTPHMWNTETAVSKNQQMTVGSCCFVHSIQVLFRQFWDTIFSLECKGLQKGQ